VSDNGIVTVESKHSAPFTARRLEAAIEMQGLTIFARIDHAANAASAGLTLRATEVFIFGNAKGGTALMQDQQTAGIDLPLKMLIWEDATGQVRLSYNSPEWVARRHGLGDASVTATGAMITILQTIAHDAAN
jgi:uncharacterized protein (DUF302 family)